MTAPPARTGNTAPDDRGAVFEAVADAVAIAGGYIEIAAQAASLRDARALAYGVRCASAALLTAADLTGELRPSLQQGGRPA